MTRKSLTLADHVAAVNAAAKAAEAPKKRRGRPAKVEVATPAPKRRGRPAKAPRAALPDPTDTRTGYVGPMLALRDAAERYVRVENGQKCCGDELALTLGEHSRDVVVGALIRALGFESNPYPHLNPGQQSMNLRNKARAALKRGTLKMSVLRAALGAVR